MLLELQLLLMVMIQALRLQLLGGYKESPQAWREAHGEDACIDLAGLLIVDEGICLIHNLLLCAGRHDKQQAHGS
jgi:hypothetical protein